MYRKTFVTVGRGSRINSCICRLKVLKKQNIKLYICTSYTKFFWVSITAHKPCISNISQAHAYLLLLFLYLFYSMHAGSPLPITHIEIPSVFAIWEHSCQTFLSPWPTRGDISEPKRETGAWSYIYRLLAWETHASYIQRGV